MAEQTETFDEWCVLELMGHRRLAGRVREVQIAGSGFLRLDVPAADDTPGATQFIAPGSVYAIHPVDEQTARLASARFRPEPISQWEIKALTALPSPRPGDDGYDEWAEEGMAMAADPDPDYGRDLDEDDDEEEDE